MNAIDTETSGVDIVSTWSGLTLLGGDVGITLAANFTDTDISRIFSQSPTLGALPASDIFGGFQPSVIETWQPEDRVSLSGTWSKDRWSANLAFNRYGEYTTVDSGSQTYGSELLTDIHVSYALSDTLNVFVAGNNIFDVTPDEVTNSGSRGGLFESVPGAMDMASPSVFKYSRRSAPFGFNLCEGKFNSFATHKACAAKASLDSIISMSSIVKPVFSSTCCTAGIGPVPINEGSTPARE